MKRYNNLYNKVIDINNLILADKKARKGKLKQCGVRIYDKNYGENLKSLHNMLLNKTYRTSEYTTFKIFEPKERVIFRLPYFPDRITHHAIMNIIEPIFMSSFTADTYSCIKGRGIHKASYNLRKALKDVDNTQYCLKLDIRKFYPSVNHDILKTLLRRKIKDKDLLWLLDEIIESTDGLPIGNYLSQTFANFYLSGFDHWIKEVKKVKYVFRYADDIILLSSNKEDLHQLLGDIRSYLNDNLKLTIKDNYQIFPVKARGIDFVGYKHFHYRLTLLRKSIKKNFARMVAKRINKKSLASYYGWVKHCNGANLWRKLTKVHG